MAYEQFSEMFENFNGELWLYISGSQGVAPNEMKVVYGVDFSSLDELEKVFCEFIDENAFENIADYLDDCDGDEDEAMMEAVNDSGEFLIGVSMDKLTHEYNGMFFDKIVTT